MSFLTRFPEDVYPTHRLAEAIQMDTFSIERTQALMWMSQAAYETTAERMEEHEEHKLERILDRWGFECRAWLSQGGTEGFVAESDAALVVAFAGTDPVVAANWITDFNIRTGSGGIHRGFSDGVERVWPALVAALKGTSKPISLTGHSLGGALAVVAAWRLVGDGPELSDKMPSGGLIDTARIAGVFAFGMPRVGDEEFAEAYRLGGLWQKTARLEYGADIVPSLPPAATGQLGFRHVGPALHCPHGGQFKDVLPLRDDPDEPIVLAQLEEMLGITDSGTLRNLRKTWSCILAHGVRRSPAGGTATLLIDRLPFFLRDHLQDCYLEALGWSFTRPPEARVSISADDADKFARTSESTSRRAAVAFRHCCAVSSSVTERTQIRRHHSNPPPELATQSARRVIAVEVSTSPATHDGLLRVLDRATTRRLLPVRPHCCASRTPRQGTLRNTIPDDSRRCLRHNGRSGPESTPDERSRPSRDGRRRDRDPRGRRPCHRAACVRATDLRTIHHCDRLAVAGPATGAAA